MDSGRDGVQEQARPWCTPTWARCRAIVGLPKTVPIRYVHQIDDLSLVEMRSSRVTCICVTLYSAIAGLACGVDALNCPYRIKWTSLHDPARFMRMTGVLGIRYVFFDGLVHSVVV
jgi:hypothetical protein